MFETLNVEFNTLLRMNVFWIQTNRSDFDQLLDPDPHSE
jgi:hypothetical protein